MGLRALGGLNVKLFSRCTAATSSFAAYINRYAFCWSVFLLIGLIFMFVLGVFVGDVSAIKSPQPGEVCGDVGLLSGLYWATATITTVGYGDFIACSNVGRVLSIFGS